MIKQAAIRHEGTIYTLPRPSRHCDIIRDMVTNHGVKPPVGREQGFITHTGEFVDRITAADIALRNMQCQCLNASPNLFSEDLW